MNGMTIKQLAEFFGKGENTIRRTAVRLGFRAQNGIALIFNQEQVEQISEAVFSKVPLAVKEAIRYTFPKGEGSPLPNGKVEFGDHGLPHDIEMIMLGYKCGIQDGMKQAPASPVHPSRKALPAPRLQREPITGATGSTRINLYPDYPITLRGLARLLNVDPAIVRRHSDHLGYPLSGHQERAFTSEHARAIWASILTSRAESGRKTE